MHALSVCQPYAERLANGSKPIEYRSWRAPSIVGKDLLIVASKKTWEGYAGEPTGVAICVVRVVRMAGDPGAYEWHVTGPRRVAPFAVRGYAGLYKVPDELIRYVVPLATDRAPRTRLKRPALEETNVDDRGELAGGPYSFSIGDRGLRGQRAKTPAAARALARELAERHGTTITISRDGIAIGGEG